MPRGSVEIPMGALALHSHRFLLRAGLAIGNIFAWVFIFEYFFLASYSVSRALAGVLILYALSQAITIFITPLASAQLRFGTRRALLWGVLLAGTAFVILGATLSGYFESAGLWGVALFAITLGIYRALYFAPYELSRAISERGAFPDRMFYEFILAALPAFAGATLLLETFAPLRLLFGAGVLVLLSALPLLFLQNMHERFSFHYIETFKELFSPRNSRIVWLSFLEGVQGAVLFLIWPLTVFMLVGWSYPLLGAILSLTLLSVILLRGVYRRFLSMPGIARSTPLHVTLAMSGWVLRIVAGTPIGIIVADTYGFSTRPLSGTAMDPLISEQAADGGSFVDEYTTLKEMALALGRTALVIALYVLLLVVPYEIVFMLALGIAAIASGIAVVLARQHQHPLV